MRYRSITGKLILFLVISGVFFSGISTFINAGYLLNRYEQALHERNQERVNSIRNSFVADMRQLENSVEMLTIMTQEIFQDVDRGKTPDMNEMELDYESLFRANLESGELESGSIYIYFNPELDGDIHDVWLYTVGDEIQRQDEIPLERYETNDNMSWFYGPMVSMTSAWVKPYRNRYDEHITSYVAPVYVGDVFIGIIGMYLKLENTTGQLQRLSQTEEGIFWLYNTDGEVIYHPQYEEGKPVDSFFWYGEDRAVGRSFMDGIPYYSYTGELDTGWEFVYSVPAGVFRQERIRAQLTIGIIFAVTMALLSLVLILIISHYRRGMDSILTALREIGKGNLNYRIELESHDEIGLLIDAINKSNEALNEAMTEKDRLAYTYRITGLPNRLALIRDIDALVDDGTHRGFSLVAVDIDRFRHINELLGYSKGDEFIRLIANMLNRYSKDMMTMYHTNVDEFVFLVDSHVSDDYLTVFSKDLLRGFGRNFSFGNHRFFLTLSIGIVRRTQEMISHEEIFRAADIALTEAKFAGRNQWALYSHDMYEAFLAINELERDFVTALKRDQFVLYYQPKISIEEGGVYGVEALVRWNHPTKGIVVPDKFIPFAEKSGLIVALGEIVLTKACQQLKAWAEMGLRECSVAVNISPRQLLEKDFVESFIQIVNSMDIRPYLIEIEITESMYMDDYKRHMRQIKALKAQGFKISLDDFGTGYSSIKSISEMPLDSLKIDKSLIQDSANTQKDMLLLETIVAMTHKLGLKVIAEGVETKEQFETVQTLGCDMVQGYYFSKPVPPEELSMLED